MAYEVLLKSKVTDEEIVSLRNKGFLHREIAEIVGLSTATITQRLRKVGMSTYNHQREEIMRLHNDGLYDHEIAEILGCSRSNVTIALNRMGVHNRRSNKTADTVERISSSLIGRFTGESNPNYKGYKDEKVIARGIFKTFSKRLLRQSNYTCLICGKHGGNLETHHIKPFGIIMQDFIEHHYDGNINTIYDQLMSFPDFIDESNMVVLCHKCHHDIHYTDNPELSPYRWESATTIESTS